MCYASFSCFSIAITALAQFLIVPKPTDCSILLDLPVFLCLVFHSILHMLQECFGSVVCFVTTQASRRSQLLTFSTPQGLSSVPNSAFNLLRFLSPSGFCLLCHPVILRFMLFPVQIMSLWFVENFSLRKLESFQWVQDNLSCRSIYMKLF